MTFINMAAAESFEDSQLHGGIYDQVLGNPLTWMQLGLIYGIFGTFFWVKRVCYGLIVEP